MSTPLVTVIMPVFNAASTLQQAIDSVRWQGVDGIQFIAVDDGSTDGSLEILQAQGPFIECHRQASRGPAAARNLALRHARGDLIAFIDADDIWLPGKLKAQLAFMAQCPEVDAVYGDFERWEPTAGHYREMPAPEAYSMPGDIDLMPTVAHLRDLRPGHLYVDMLQSSVIHIITAVVRRRAVDAVQGFDEQCATGSDYDFWLRLSRQAVLAHLAAPLAWYRIHPHSITKRVWADNGEYLVLRRAVARHGVRGVDGRELSASVLARRQHHIAFGHAYLLFWQRQPRLALRYFLLALRHEWWHPKDWGYLLLSALWASCKPTTAATSKSTA